MRGVVAFLGMVTVGALASDAQSLAPLSRTVPIHVTLKLPATACTVGDVVAHVAKLLGVPAGVEYPPEPCKYPPGRVDKEVPLIGKTFHDVLDLLVKTDPRYYWTETDGVVILRPLAAWTAKNHFLHAAVDPLELKDANIGAAMDAILPGPFGHRGGVQIMAADPAKITVSTSATSMAEALDAIVRAHGRARWEVKYCLPEMQAEVATVRIVSYDERGLGRRAAFDRGPDGQLIDRCRPK
jgi:hypothetical protein